MRPAGHTGPHVAKAVYPEFAEQLVAELQRPNLEPVRRCGFSEGALTCQREADHTGAHYSGAVLRSELAELARVEFGPGSSPGPRKNPSPLRRELAALLADWYERHRLYTQDEELRACATVVKGCIGDLEQVLRLCEGG